MTAAPERGFRRRLAGYHPTDVAAALAALTRRAVEAEAEAAAAVEAARLESAARRSYQDVLGLAHQLACAIVSDARETAARITAEAAAAADRDGTSAASPRPTVDPLEAGAVDEVPVLGPDGPELGDVDGPAFDQFLACPPDPSRAWLDPAAADPDLRHRR